MTDGPEEQVPEQHRPIRQPDSIWERYLTGKLSLTDKETLPALIKELHREIAEHLGKHGDRARNTEADPDLDPMIHPLVPPVVRKPRPVIDIKALRAHLARRRPIDPRRN